MNVAERFKDSFLVGTNRLLDELGALLLRGESKKELSAEDIDDVFRILHTIKGSAGMVDLSALSHLAHTLEGLFLLLKKEGGLAHSRRAGLFDMLFEATDSMKASVEEYATDTAQSRDFSQLIKKISDWQDSITETVSLRITLHENCDMENVRAYLIVTELMNLSSNLMYYPTGLDVDEGTSKIIRDDGLYIRFAKADGTEILKALERDVYVDAVSPVEGFPSQPKAEDAIISSPASPHRDTIAQNHVAVRMEKLENLQNLANELILAQERMLLSLGAGIAQSANIVKQSAQLQRAVMELRMTQASVLFQKLHRTAREAGRKLNKEIEFVGVGWETEIDKGILDALSESMIQLVRNAVAHGIEPTPQRVTQGKPLMGRITVSAKNSGAIVVLTVADDGRGISPESAVKAAIKAGCENVKIPETQDELLKLIMQPRVTTTSEADEMSGRGVGLDVVKSAIEGLKGTISLRTQVGRGSAFTIRVGQSLAVMDCVRLSAGSALFLLPTGDIYRLLRPRREDVITLPSGKKFLRFQGCSLPVVDLGEFYELREGEPDMANGVVAILEGESSAVAIYADALLPPVKASIKPLPGLINALGAAKRHLAGCALLHDQTVGLVLDAEGLLGAREAV